MTSTGDALSRADRPVTEGGLRPTEKAPPRPEGTRADVSIHTDRSDKAHVDINTREGDAARPSASCSWPKDAEEWKRFLAKAAPWIIGITIVAAAGVSAYNQACEHGDGDAARRKARKAGQRIQEAGEEAAEGARRGWFGLKNRAADAADEAEGRWEEAKGAAARKGKEVKESARGVAGRADEAGRDVASAVSQKAYEAKEAVKSTAYSAAEGTRRAAERTEHALGKAGAKVLEKEGSAQEQAGKAVKAAGQRIEEDGRNTKQWARGEDAKQEAKKRCAVM